jgi:CPA2 family monovalent cation:H+ antiporter-2
VLSSTLLPSLPVLLVLLVILAPTTWLLWRASIRIYSKAQIALKETFAQPPPSRPHDTPAALQSLVRDADLEAVSIKQNSPAAGKLIRELELRTRTGASIVGVQRGDTRIINPGPDEEILSGDQVLLLGTQAQLAAGGKALTGN